MSIANGMLSAPSTWHENSFHSRLSSSTNRSETPRSVSGKAISNSCANTGSSAWTTCSRARFHDAMRMA